MDAIAPFAWPSTPHRSPARAAQGDGNRRDGRAVTAHYGSGAAEVAACRKYVGLAVRTELRILEAAGREPWLERPLARASP